jgi:transposase
MSPLLTTTPLVALDIGKNVHVYGTYRIEDVAPIDEPVKIYNNRVGFEHFAHHLNALLACYPTVKLAHEPTGIYYEAFGREILTQFAEPLTSKHLEYYLVNPQLVKESRTALQRGRVRKTDAIDTQAIARCLQQGDVMPARFPDGHVLLFQQWALRFRRNQHDKRRLENHLMMQMDRLWPGAFVNVKRFKRQHPDLEPPVPLVETCPLERKLVQVILTHCPNPYDVLAFTVEDMVEFLRDYLGRGSEKTARKVLRNVRQALLPPEPIARILAHGLQEEWQTFQRCLTFEAQLEVEAATLVPLSPAAVLVSVPGMSAYHAARYLAGIGDAARFPSADHIWSFAGFDPLLIQSGDTQRLGQISKRGDPAFRDTLARIGRSLADHCPPITAAYQRVYRGYPKRRVLATLHAAHKANRLLYHLLLTQESYHPERHR